MSPFNLFLGIVLAAVGALFTVFAERVIIAIDFESKRFHYGRATFAVAFGAFLLLAASSLSKSPDLVRILGIAAFVGGLALFTLPHAAWVRITRWWTKDHLTLYRVLTVITTSVLGGLLVISALG